MPKDSWAVIANPVAGRGKAARGAALLTSALEERGAEAVLSVTGGPGNAESRATAAVDAGANKIVACGGDGTVHEIVNGIMASGEKASGVSMGVLAAGRCNDLCYALGLPGRPAAAVRGLLESRVRLIDLGRVGDRYFSTIATLGFDSEVSEYVDLGRHPSFLRGSAAYLYAAVVKLYRYSHPEVTLRGDFGEFSGPLFLAATGNTDRYGGRIRITPEARPDDGALDVCMVSITSKLEILRTMPKTFGGGHVGHPAVSIERTRRLEIESERPLWVWADGERMGKTPATIEVVPEALRVMVPR